MSPRSIAFLLALLAGAACAHGVEIVASVTDRDGKPLAGAVVVAVPADGNLRMPARPREDAIFQVAKEFVPRVSVVLVGTAVSFPNNDTVRHHVYSFSAAKRFELPLYSGVPAQPVVFDKPGLVVLGCNIHDWMVAYVYVSESPHFAITGSDGQATIGELAPRAYSVRVWHPELVADEAETRKEVNASRGRRSDVAWALAVKPAVRIARPPAGHRHGGY